MNADSASHGSDMRQLTFGSDEDDSPAWSPDGKKIDVVCPTDLALAAFNRAVEPKQLELYPGGHFSAYTDQFYRAAKAATEWFTQHLRP